MLLAACNSGRDVAAPPAPGTRDAVVEIDATNVGAPTIRIAVGQALRIRLPASPASGQDWVLDGDLPPFLRVETDPGLDPAQGPAPRIVQTWSFRACQRGRGRVRFLRRPPWDAGAASARRETLDIVAD
ncbi:protease inhibitor I42 family protein [Lysobacter sp. KIS68-7]|uniref:protease inhibitor I42 family protein n=1 Tax=Lysobacter sp. KIS68-7 TaxID=2904252 RepID=UPI0031BA3333